MNHEELAALAKEALGHVQSMDQTSPLSHRKQKVAAVEKLTKLIALLEAPRAPLA